MRWQPSEIKKLPYSQRVKLREMNIRIEEDQRDRMKGNGTLRNRSTDGRAPTLPPSSNADTPPAPRDSGVKEWAIKPPSSSPPKRNPRRPRKKS